MQIARYNDDMISDTESECQMLKVALPALLIAGITFIAGCAVIGLADLRPSHADLAFKLWGLTCLALFAVACEDLRGRK